jgi:hypothetical protein
MDVEIGSNINESQGVFESFTKMSEISKSEVQVVPDNNEVNLVIFKNQNVQDNLKVNTSIKKKITLKDFVFYLESLKRSPLHNILLHKAIIKMNQ